MKTFTLKPYKHLIFITLPINVLAVALSAFLVSTAFTSDAPLTANGIGNLVFFCLFGVLNIAMGIFVCKASRKTITFTAEGVTFASRTTQWSELPYIYTALNAKNAGHIILSPTPLSKDEIKTLMRKNELPPCRILIGDRFVFPLDDDGVRTIRQIRAAADHA